MSSAHAQTAFISVLNPNSVTLTNQEQTSLTQVQQRGDIVTSWLVALNPIENYLNGNVLSITLPESSTVYTFERDVVTSVADGEYYWAGYNADGSSARLRKGAYDFLGHLYIAATDYHYEIASLSNDKAVLVKYTPSVISGYDGCSLGDEEDEDSDDEVEDRSGCADNKVRVLFLHTAAAAALGPPSPTSVALSVISELNAATQESGLTQTDVFFESAGSVLLTGFMESSNIGNDLSALSSSSTVHNLRNTYKGDIVVLLTANAYPEAGRAKRIAASNSNAYCIVEVPAARFAMTGSHEIAHIIGARHQRCVVCLVGGCDPLTNHHGYLVGDDFRTIMVQQDCGSGVRTRIGRFSNPDAPFMGWETGNWWNKNAQKLKSRAGKVACFRESPNYLGEGQGQAYILTSINGSPTVPNCQGYYPYSSTVSLPYQAPLIYKWEISPLGVGNWTTVSTSSSYLLTDPTNWPNYWMTLRLTVTDANGWTGFAFKEIQRVECFDGGGDDRATLKTNSIPTYYPNPVKDILTLQNIFSDSQVSIFDANGIQISNFSITQQAVNQQVFDLTRLHPGVHWLSVKNAHQTFTFKFVKI